MATGHRVSRPLKLRVPLPREVEIVGERDRVDRFGNVFTVVWSGHRFDPSLLHSDDDNPLYRSLPLEQRR